jgi:predicted nucleotidyltransferase
MIIHNILDGIFSRWSNLAVLRALNKYAVGITGREVSRAAGLSIKNCFNALNDLENLGIISRVRGGRDHLFTLNRDHFIVNKALLPLFEIEKNYFDFVISDIKKKLKSKTLTVYIFGSVARKEEDISSDLDLAIVYETKLQKETATELVSELVHLLHKKYFITLSPFLISKNEFIRRLKKNKSPVNAIVREGILLLDKLGVKKHYD